MQISLRSQMLAGTTALVGATAIAMTPIAPAISLPALSPTKAAVALAAFDNPFNALLATAGTVVHYTLSSSPTGAGNAAFNWPGAQVSNTIDTGVLPDLGVATAGLIPNILANPFPVATQLVNNWLGYTGTAINTGAAVLGAVSTIAWLPVNLAGTIVSLVLAGDIAGIPAAITATVNSAIATATGAVTLAIAGVTSIVTGIITRATALATTLSTAVPQLVTYISGQITALSSTVTNVVSNITAGAATGGLAGAWNAGVVGLLSTVAPVGSGYTGLTLPGTVVGLTEGAGVQIVPGEGAAAGSFVPSVRTVGTGLATAVAGALATPIVTSPVAAVRTAAAKTAAPVAAASSDAAAPVKAAAAKVGRHAAAAKAAAAK
ncbi:MAG: hypothetical protein ACOYBX_08795 [Mycobacterium sp.]|jgi:hypothetical protein